MEKKNLAEILKNNSYPGRGIVIGKSDDGKYAVTAYLSWEEAPTHVTESSLKTETV